MGMDTIIDLIQKEEMEKITTALNNNTLALTELKDKIGG